MKTYVLFTLTIQSGTRDAFKKKMSYIKTANTLNRSCNLVIVQRDMNLDNLMI